MELDNARILMVMCLKHARTPFLRTTSGSSKKINNNDLQVSPIAVLFVKTHCLRNRRNTVNSTRVFWNTIQAQQEESHGRLMFNDCSIDPRVYQVHLGLFLKSRTVNIAIGRCCQVPEHQIRS